ncbi:MAG TPA: dTMP kinase [Gammaproteobacteria bacterium]|jgi:dTMP kinase|nr:dTMP kinase [Gammaproteobacteria bacterium]HIA95418.1 dTMP kinase [Gammaproteobacteria bacterium]HIG49568.1 dTMP kinase [Gammaproteobacteria bacterium]HIO43230.1 dTMP kinase [Gammaproteobacteria bacterium]
MKAKFITLEGIEGSGKTSSLKSITDLLDKKNISYIVTREPGGSSIGKELRAILLDPDTEISPEVELMLMLSDRKDHVEKIILPNLEKGNWVVSDRFMDSSIAYQGGGRQLDKKLIISLTDYLNLPQPDLTLLFDLPVEISLSRVKARGELDRFEKEELEFHKRIRNTYLDLAKNNSNRIKIIDSSKKIESMLNNVKQAIEKLFSE